MDQEFEKIHYSQSLHLHKEAFGTFTQTNVESINENFENIGAVVSNKLIVLRKITITRTSRTTVTESQMTIKYLKDMSIMLAIVAAVREGNLDHISYARHNTYRNSLLRREQI